LLRKNLKTFNAKADYNMRTFLVAEAFQTNKPSRSYTVLKENMDILVYYLPVEEFPNVNLPRKVPQEEKGYECFSLQRK